MKKLATALLVLVMILACSSTAFAATERLTLRDSDVIGGVSTTDYSKLELDGSEATKEIYIEPSAFKYLDSKDTKITVDMDDLKITFTADIFKTAEYQKAIKTGSTLSYKLIFELKEDVDTWKYNFNNMSTGQMMGYNGINLEAWILVDGVSTYELAALAQPISATYEYEWDYSYSMYKEDNVGMYWVDPKASEDKSRLEWKKMPGTLNLKEDEVKFEMPYGKGVYFPIIAAGGSSTGDGGNTGVNGNNQLYGHWAESAIVAMQQKGIVSYDLSKVDLNSDITRAEFCYYLAKTLSLGTGDSITPVFTDIPKDHVYYDEIYAAAAAGIVKGQTTSTFVPNAKISRQEMAVMLSRALTHAEKATDKSEAGIKTMADYAKVAVWAKEGATVAYNAKLMGGRENNMFAPLGNTTWAEAVVILFRLSAV